MKTAITVWIFVMGVMFYGIFIMKAGNKEKTVIKQTTDERGLTSVIYKDGKDTFALDYLTPFEYDSTFKRIDGLIKTNYICPDCGEWGCIYEQIDEAYDEGTDTEILNAIYKVCNERGIKDSTTIELLKANYYL